MKCHLNNPSNSIHLSNPSNPIHPIHPIQSIHPIHLMVWHIDLIQLVSIAEWSLHDHYMVTTAYSHWSRTHVFFAGWGFSAVVVIVSGCLCFKVVAHALDRVGAQDAEVVPLSVLAGTAAGAFALLLWPPFFVFLELWVLFLASSSIVPLFMTGVSLTIGESRFGEWTGREEEGGGGAIGGSAAGSLGESEDSSGEFWVVGLGATVLWETGSKEGLVDTLPLLLVGRSCKPSLSESSSSSKELSFNISKWGQKQKGTEVKVNERNWCMPNISRRLDLLRHLILWKI